MLTGRDLSRRQARDGSSHSGTENSSVRHRAPGGLYGAHREPRVAVHAELCQTRFGLDTSELFVSSLSSMVARLYDSSAPTHVDRSFINSSLSITAASFLNVLVNINEHERFSYQSN